MSNKKGDKGYIVGHWNTLNTSTSAPRDGIMQIAVTSVEVKSCGKVQMTLLERETGKMHGRYHAPNRPVYKTFEQAAIAAREMFDQWVIDSRVATIRRVENWEPSYCGDVDEHISFIRQLNNSDIPFEIVER